jgi:YidC/Oxa1 family membrane protein insertase
MKAATTRLFPNRRNRPRIFSVLTNNDTSLLFNGQVMDKLRLYVWIALAAALYICYMIWQHDYPSPTEPTAPVASAPSPASGNLPALPSNGSAPQSTVAAPSVPAVGNAEIQPAAASITVLTDVLDLSISTRGGELDRADLLKYPVNKDTPGSFIRLFDSAAENFYVARSGLRAADEHTAPTHQAMYSSAADSYRLAPGQETLEVPLVWTEGSVKVTKTYTFTRGSYVVGVNYKVENQSASEWKAASYVQLARHQPIVKASMMNAESYAFIGPSVYDGKNKTNLKLDSDDSKNFHGAFTGGWLAAMQHHFVAAAVPKPDQPYDYQLNVESPQQFTFTYRGPLVTVPAGAAGELHETLFVGPKIQSQLELVGSKLELTADYGKLTIVASPLFLVLAKVHSFVGNWGWSIILVTVLIKAVFYKLTEASGKSMAKMREVAPRLKALQERYKDDREQLGRATMEFYKREKINPLAGCLPTVIQMPVWMAFYWVILNSAEMRQAPFIGYLSDLSSRDPYFILPLILGAANFAQFKLNPSMTTDPVQAKVMMLMPLLMTGMMAFFPAGLALYWITNTGLSILQQWYINRVVAAAAAAKKN